MPLAYSVKITYNLYVLSSLSAILTNKQLSFFLTYRLLIFKELQVVSASCAQREG